MNEQKPGRLLPTIFMGHEVGVPRFASLAESAHAVKEWAIIPHLLPERPLYLFHRDTGHLVMITDRATSWTKNTDLGPSFTSGLFVEVFQIDEQEDINYIFDSPLPNIEKGEMSGFSTVIIEPGNFPLPPSADTIHPQLASAISHFDDTADKTTAIGLVKRNYPLGEQRYSGGMSPHLLVLSDKSRPELFVELSRIQGLGIDFIAPSDLETDDYANFFEQFRYERGISPAFIAIDEASMSLYDYQKCLNVVAETERQSFVFATVDAENRTRRVSKYTNGRYVGGKNPEDFRKLMEKLTTDFRLTQIVRGHVALKAK